MNGNESRWTMFGFKVTQLLLVLGIIASITGCVSGTMNLVDEARSGEPATITAATKFYFFAGYSCGILEVDGVSSESIVGPNNELGAKRAVISNGLHNIKARCYYGANYFGINYRGNLDLLAKEGRDYTILLQNSRKCIVIIDDENKEVASDCNLTCPLRPSQDCNQV